MMSKVNPENAKLPENPVAFGKGRGVRGIFSVGAVSGLPSQPVPLTVVNWTKFVICPEAAVMLKPRLQLGPLPTIGFCPEIGRLKDPITLSELLTVTGTVKLTGGLPLVFTEPVKFQSWTVSA
jgi:hypothetical protein